MFEFYKPTVFKPGNKAAKAFVGFGTGGSSLDLQYKRLDSHGVSVSTWDDSVGSSKGGLIVL